VLIAAAKLQIDKTKTPEQPSTPEKSEAKKLLLHKNRS